ncbi:hypothetical protein AAGG52_06665 [Bacillus licheniformis]
MLASGHSLAELKGKLAEAQEKEPAQKNSWQKKGKRRLISMQSSSGLRNQERYPSSPIRPGCKKSGSPNWSKSGPQSS